MRSLRFASASIAAIASAALLTLSMTPASAFTLSSPSIEQSVANTQIEKAYYYGHRYYGHRHYYHGGWRYY